MDSNEIQKWVEEHDVHDLSANEIARQIILEAINHTTFAEDYYPGIKDDLIRIVNEMRFHNEQ